MRGRTLAGDDDIEVVLVQLLGQANSDTNLKLDFDGWMLRSKSERIAALDIVYRASDQPA